jgi:hypothetical protein
MSPKVHHYRQIIVCLKYILMILSLTESADSPGADSSAHTDGSILSAEEEMGQRKPPTNSDSSPFPPNLPVGRPYLRSDRTPESLFSSLESLPEEQAQPAQSHSQPAQCHSQPRGLRRRVHADSGKARRQPEPETCTSSSPPADTDSGDDFISPKAGPSTRSSQPQGNNFRSILE